MLYKQFASKMKMTDAKNLGFEQMKLTEAQRQAHFFTTEAELSRIAEEGTGKSTFGDWFIV
jgi:hypothetical protein